MPAEIPKGAPANLQVKSMEAGLPSSQSLVTPRFSLPPREPSSVLVKEVFPHGGGVLPVSKL